MTYVGFVCESIFHFHLFKNMVHLLADDSIFIIPWSKDAGRKHLQERLKAYLDRQGMKYVSAEEVLTGKISVIAIVSPYWMNWFSFLDRNTAFIRMMYGYAKDKWNYFWNNRYFDIALVYGKYAYRKLSPLVPCVVVGNPRFDTYQSLIHKCYYLKDIYGQSVTAWLTGRKVLTYCPTWGELSSLSYLKDVLPAIAREFDLIIKLHHGLVLEVDTHELSHGMRTFICDETVDLFEVLALTDLVLSDYSGAIFDALLAGKRVVLFDIPAEERQRWLRKLPKLFSREDEESLDLIIRDYIPHVANCANLLQTIKQTMDVEWFFPESVLSDLFEYRDSYCSQRAARAILTARKREDSLQLVDISKLQHFAETEPGDREWVIWGAGELGRLMQLWLARRGVTVSFFVDSDPGKQGQLIQGKRILPPEAAVLSRRGNVKLIIGSYEGRASLRKLLKIHGCREGLDFLDPFCKVFD